MSPAGKLPPLAGNLDVPPSVWAGRHTEKHLPEGLIAVYTEANGLVVDATGAALIPAVSAGRRCVSLIPEDRDHLAELLDTFDTERRHLGQVRLVDVDELPSAVAAFTDEAGLVIATCAATRAEGWWTAARGALLAGGHVAIVCATADLDLHATIVAAATSAGLAFTQHLVTASTAVLDNAVAVEKDLDARRPRRAHKRSHHDVYLFRNPASTTGPPTARRAS